MNKYVVSKNNDGLRIDSFILRINKDISRSLIYKFIRKRKIRINNKRVTDPKTILKEGDEVVLNFFIEEKKEKRREVKQVDLKNEIIYEDSNLLVLNKPNNFSMHSGKNNYNERVFGYLNSKGVLVKDQAFQIHHLHRLDKNTKGIVIYAKTREAYQYLDKQFKNREVEKEYIALVFDRNKKLTRVPLTLEENIGIDDGNPFITKDPEEGKMAKIEVKKIDEFRNFSLIRIKCFTGRKHQIRLLCSSAGLPIVNDAKYGLKETSNNMLLFSEKIAFLEHKDTPLNKHNFVLDIEWIKDFIIGELSR